MKVLALNVKSEKPLIERFDYFLSLPQEHRNTLYRERGYSYLLEKIPHQVLPCGMIFPFTTIDEGLRIWDHLLKMINMYPEQTFVEIANGIYCSGPLLRQLKDISHIPRSEDWKFHKTLVFRSGELIREVRLPAGTGASALFKDCVSGEKIIEVLCLEWEYFDKYVINYWYEWGGECFWSGNLKAEKKFSSPISPDLLPVSDRTKKRINEMIEWHESFIGRLGYGPGGFDNKKSEEDYQFFFDAASELLPVIREELGNEYEIIPC